MKKLLISAVALALGVAVVGTAEAARHGPGAGFSRHSGGPTTTTRSYTPGGYHPGYRPVSVTKGKTTLVKTTTTKKIVPGKGLDKGKGYDKGKPGKVAPLWVKFGGKNYKTLSAGYGKFKYRCWHKGYRCWCFYDRGCGWCFWCARYSCFLPCECISFCPPAEGDAPEVGGPMPPVLPGSPTPPPARVTPPEGDTPPPPPPGADTDADKKVDKDGDKQADKDSDKDADKDGDKDGSDE